MSRRVVAAIAALGLLLGLLLVITARPAPGEGELIFSYSSLDAGPGGVLALRRWLATLGYQTRTIQGSRFTIPSEVDLLFVLGPVDFVSREDAQHLRDWVEGGKTLVVASDRTVLDDALFEAFGARLEPRGGRAIEGALSPSLALPPLKDVSSATTRVLNLREAAAVLVADGERPIVTVRRVGRGTLVLSSAPDVFANGNLPAAGNDRFVLNLIADLRAGAVVGFDEFHHGAHVDTDAPDLLLGTPPGRALLFAGIGVFVYVALRGRRLGSPLSLEERPARSALDYIRSFAALLRRASSRSLAGERLARAFRRRLARALGLRLTSADDEILGALARVDVDRAARARSLLTAFERSSGDAELLASVARAEELVAEVERR